MRIGEFLNIICPKYAQDTEQTEQIEYHTIYMVTRKEFDECQLNSNGNSHRLLLRCDRPFDSLKYTLYISKFSPVPDAIEFTEGKDYFIVCKCFFFFLIFFISIQFKRKATDIH